MQLSIPGHVGSNPTLSARRLRPQAVLPLVGFFIADRQDTDEAQIQADLKSPCSTAAFLFAAARPDRLPDFFLFKSEQARGNRQYAHNQNNYE